MVQKRSGSEEVEPITPQWLRTGSGGGVASAQTGLQLFYNLVWGPDSAPSNATHTLYSQPLGSSIFHIIRTTSPLHQRQTVGGVDVGQNYFTIILQSSVGTLEADSEVDAGL